MGVDISNATAAANVESYRSIFEGYINARTNHLMQLVQQADFVHNSNAQKKLMHTLSYAFESKDSWLIIQDLLLAAAPLMQRAGYRQEWIPYLQTGIEKSKEFGDVSVYAQLNYELGFIFQAMGQLHDAQTYYEIGISNIDCGDELLTYAKIVNKLAFVKRLQQNHQESEQLILELLTLLHPTDPEYGKGHLVLGWIAYDKHDWEKSEYHFRKALDIWDADSNPSAYASGLRDLATVLHMQQRYEQAIAYYQNSEEIFNKISESHMCAVSIMNLGNVYLSTRQPQKAIEHFRRARIEFRRVQDLHHLALAYLNIGIAYRDLKQLTDSADNLTAAISIWERIGATDMLVNMLDELGTTYIRAHNNRLAILTLSTALEHLPKINNSLVRTYYRQKIREHLQEAEIQSFTPASKFN